MSVNWSGPGRALQAHLDLFAQVERTHHYINQNAGKRVDLLRTPPALRQRLKLSTSMADARDDGDTVAIRRDSDDIRDMGSERNVGRATGMIGHEYAILNEGGTIYVAHSISAALWDIALDADDEPLFPTDLLAPKGLIVFEQPLILNDLHPETGVMVEGLSMPVRAIAWTTANIYSGLVSEGAVEKPGIWYVLYTDTESYRAYYLTALSRLLGETVPSLDAEMLPMWPIDSSGWIYGSSWRRGGDVHTLGAVVHDNVAIMRRFLLTLMRFSWQRILVPTVYRPTRAEMRRALRVKPLEDGYVKVLRVRRVVEAEARGERSEGDGWYLTHAFVRRGHPRRQHYPSLGPARNEDGSFNHDSHRLIWIEPTIVGDGPLVVGHNVTAIVR